MTQSEPWVVNFARHTLASGCTDWSRDTITKLLRAYDEAVEAQQTLPRAPGYEGMKKLLSELEADKRLAYPAAAIQINAPLALVQVELKARCAILRWALGLQARRYHGQDEDDPA